jgi:hypothetical protein
MVYKAQERQVLTKGRAIEMFVAARAIDCPR